METQFEISAIKICTGILNLTTQVYDQEYI